MAADIIIAGQGICGSLLSWSLLQKGLSVQVYDRDIAQSSTIAASGIINPITGKRFVRSWMTDELIPVADNIYTILSRELDTPFFKKLPIYKLPESIREQNDWSARVSEPGYENYFQNAEILYLDKEKINNPFGAFVISGGGKMDTSVFLNRYRDFLKKKNILVEENYDYGRAMSEKTRVVFCDGYKASQSGPFASLPWQIVKGEYLLVHIEDFYTDRIISGDTAISATPERDIYYAGATYQWHYDTEAPTDQYKNEITESLKKMLNVPFEIVYHGAGIRPSARYRRPFLGFHPVYRHIGIFNGMGTKGISLAPYFAEHLAAHIADGTALMPEVDVARMI